MKSKKGLTFFRKAVSECTDQSSRELIVVEMTAISTPLDSVPLYTINESPLVIMLLKSSHAVSSSDLFSFGTPTKCFHRLENYNGQKISQIKVKDCMCLWLSLKSIFV